MLALADAAAPEDALGDCPERRDRPLLARRRRGRAPREADGRAFGRSPRFRTPRWGLHLVDANIALGNLADLVRHQISLYERR